MSPLAASHGEANDNKRAVTFLMCYNMYFHNNVSSHYI